MTSHPRLSGSQNCRTSESRDARLHSKFVPPPNSHGLNPVDYKIWGLLQERVYKTSIKDVDELQRRIAEEWDELDQRIIIDKHCSCRVVKQTSSVCGCRWRTVWTQNTNIISDILYRNFLTHDPTLWNTAVLSSKNCLFCWVQCALCATFCNCNYYYATQRIFIKYAIANHIPWKQNTFLPNTLM